MGRFSLPHIVGLVCLSITSVTARAVVCTDSFVLREQSGAFKYIGRGQGALTEVPTPNGPVPRLVYWKSDTVAGSKCDSVYVREGGLNQGFGSPSDSEFQIPAQELQPFTCPRVLELAAFENFIAVSMSDGMVQSGHSSLMARIYLFEIGVGGQTLAPKQMAFLSAFPPTSTNGWTTFAKNLRFDHEPSPHPEGPYLSWMEAGTYGFPVSPLDVYYCRARNCNSGTNGTRSGIYNPAIWDTLTKHFLTEGGATTPPLLPEIWLGWDSGNNLSVQGGGIVYHDNLGNVSDWLDVPTPYSTTPSYINREVPLDAALGWLFFLTSNANGERRLHVAEQHPVTPGSPAVVYSHTPVANPGGEDRNFQLSQHTSWSSGVTVGDLPNYWNRNFAFENKSGDFFMVSSNLEGPQTGPAGATMGRFNVSEVMVGTVGAFLSPEPLSNLTYVPGGHSTYLLSVSRNLLLVSVVPDSRIYPQDYTSVFVNDREEIITFGLYCGD